MRTKGTIKPSTIITADWHLREDQPVAWTEDYWTAQARAIKFVKDLQEKYECPVLIAGDIFDKWKPSPFLLAWAIDHLPNEIVAIAGQHDLPNHSLELFPKCGLKVLESADKAKVLGERDEKMLTDSLSLPIKISASPYGTEIKKAEKTKLKTICLCHTMTWINKKPWPGCEAEDANHLMKKAYGFDIIIVGDNHQPFVVEGKEGNLLVSPGSLMRMSADQYDHKPRVYLWYAETNTVTPVYLPIRKEAISREHIDVAKAKNDKMEAFVKRLKDKIEIGLSFKENLKRYLMKNKTGKSVTNIVWESLEDED